MATIKIEAIAMVTLVGLGIVGCSPTVKVEAPDKPIVVNMNVKIEHELKVKIKKDLDKTIKNNPDIF